MQSMKMRVGVYALTVLSLVQFVHQMNVVSGNPCDSVMFLRLGKSGTVNCVFEEPYYGIYWYNSSNNIPVIFYQDSVKKGTGYTRGEYDIHPNGSLTINTVSLHHERIFTVEYLSSPTGIPVEFVVDITVYVEPSPTFPLINGCSNVTDDSICFSQVHNQQFLCSLHEVRPNISLSWIKRTSSGDRVLPSEHFVSPGNKWYTSHVFTLTKTSNLSLLQLLVCKVEEPSGLLERDESLILVQQRNRNISTIEVTERHVELHTELELSCAETRPMLIVWERTPKKSHTGEGVLLWYGILNGEHVSKVVYKDYSFGVSGNLEIRRTEVQHEGLYVCFSGDGLSNWVNKYQVDVYVNPEPNHLIIDGCNPNQYCVLEVGRSGNLTCSVKGIYPEVGLQLRPFYEDTIPLIKFTSNQLVSKRVGDAFHVSLSSTYEMEDTTLKKITIICQAVGLNAKWFNLDTKLDLLLVLVSEANKEPDTDLLRVPFQIAVQILIVTFTVMFTAFFVNKYKDKQREAQAESSLKELPTQDFSPTEMATRQHLFNVMETIFKSHGAETIGTSVIQNAEEIVDKYSTPFTQKVRYLQDKSMALRCDHTVPFARYIIRNKITNMKRYQIASVFRKGIEEDGRHGELYQCDFDIVSECMSLLADAECLKVISDVLQTLGFENFVTKVNHQNILEGLFKAYDVPDDRYSDLTFFMEQNFFSKETFTHANKNIPPCETSKDALAIMANITSEKAGDLDSLLKVKDFGELKRNLEDIHSDIADKINKGIHQLENLFKYCDVLGIRHKVQFDCSVACALGIYNGVVFKTTIEESVSGGPENVNITKCLASGGRYDGLFSRLEGKEVHIHAVGFAFYFEEVFNNYKGNQDIRSKETDLLITSDNDDNCINEKIKLCKESWNANIKAEMSYSCDSANSQRNTEGIRFIVHLKQSEIPKGLVNLRDTSTNEEILLEASKVTEYVNKRIK